MKKTIWIPGVIGIMPGSLILSVALADFFIPLGEKISMGVGEIFTTLSAAPVGLDQRLLWIRIGYSDQ